MSKIFVVIPTYNEADNLPMITTALFTLDIPGLEILVVDDNSPDGTAQVAESLSTTYHGKFHLMSRPGKLGLGTAYLEGFNWALQQGADYIIQMDADFSHSPDYLAKFLSLIDEYDVVVGSRYVAGGRVDERWGWGRWFLSWWANSVWVRMLLGIKAKDATAGFKCWRANALRAVGLERIQSNGYIFQVEMSYVAEKIGLRILEIPIYFEDRRVGKSKMNMRIKIDAALRVFEIRLRHRQTRSML